MKRQTIQYMKYWPLCLLFALISCVGAQKQQQQGEPSCFDLKNEADQMYNSRNLFAAKTAYQQLFHQCDDDVYSLYRLAIIDLKLGNMRASRDKFLDVIRADSSYAKAYYNLGGIYSSETKFRDLPKAKVSFEKYIDLAPDSKTSSKVKRWLANHQKISTKGVKLVSQESKSPDFQKGMSAYNQKQYELASQHFEIFLKQNSKNIDVQYKLGVCYLKLDKVAKGRDTFLRILTINDSFSKAYYNLGVLYSSNSEFKDNNKAKFFFEKYLQLEPSAKQKKSIQSWLNYH